MGLLGPNGAGKTTAFYMIVGTGAERCGSHLARRPGTPRLPMYRRAQLGVGYLPQEASVFRKLSVEDNILAILETRSELDGREREAALEKLLEELHIGHIRESAGVALSGGERRASRSRAHSPPSRASFSWTNPSPASIRSPCSTSSASSGISFRATSVY